MLFAERKITVLNEIRLTIYMSISLLKVFSSSCTG